MMRHLYGYSAALLATMAAQLLPPAPIQFISANAPVDFNAPKRRRTGKTYPFSSTRQNDRYARQIAAGKLKFND